MTTYIKKSELENYLIKLLTKFAARDLPMNKTCYDLPNDNIKKTNKELSDFKLKLTDEETEITFRGFERNDHEHYRGFEYQILIFVQKSEHINEQNNFNRVYRFKYELCPNYSSSDLIPLDQDFIGYMIKFQSGLMGYNIVEVDLKGNIEKKVFSFL